jgi:hypothetical protein
MNFRILLEDLLVEVSKKDVLIQKLGLNELNANVVYQICGPFSVFIANKFIERVIQHQRMYDPNFTREQIVGSINSTVMFNTSQRELRSIVDWFRVGLNNNFKPYQNLSFDQLLEKSHEWHDSLEVGDSDVNYKEEHPIVLDFRNEKGLGTYWVDLESLSCSEEAKRMGHCGTSSGELYSLRLTSPLPSNEKFTKNVSLVTASVGRGGVILQMKGPRNKKPSQELHKYIIPFILSDIVEKFGSEYASEEDFNLNDLTDEQIKMVHEKKPSLFEGRKGKKALQRIGLVPKQGDEDMWFELYLSPGDITYYVDRDWTVRNWVDSRGNKQKAGMFETLLSGDYWDLFDTNSDWKIALEYYTDDENKDIIKDMLKQRTNPEDIEHMSLENVIDEYDDDWEIRHALSNAMSSIESDATYTYYYRALRNALEEYGEVTQLNDDGARIKINLKDIIKRAEPDEDDLDDMFERCGDEVECVFREMLGDYFDRPDFQIDDRWSPDIDEREFNNTLNSYLGDIR